MTGGTAANPSGIGACSAASRAASTSARSRWPKLAGFAAKSAAQNAHSLISVAVNS
jgi:hypothetical protein